MFSQEIFKILLHFEKDEFYRKWLKKFIETHKSDHNNIASAQLVILFSSHIQSCICVLETQLTQCKTYKPGLSPYKFVLSGQCVLCKYMVQQLLIHLCPDRSSMQCYSICTKFKENLLGFF